MKYSRYSWFTLIELMVVITIVGIVSLATYMPYAHHQKKTIVKQAVKENLGVSLVSASTIIDEVGRGTLAAVPIAGGTLNKTLLIVQREETVADASYQSFIQHIGEYR